MRPARETIRSYLRFFSHVAAAGACTSAAVLVAAGDAGRVPLFAVLLSLTAPLGPVLRELMDDETGAPAPADLQRMADQLARTMGTRPVSIRVTADQPGVAALRGLTPGTKRITVGERELRLPTKRILAILAHELAHAKGRHQLKGLILSVLVWLLPQTFGSLVFYLFPGHEWSAALASVAAGVTTGASVLVLYALLRRQEHQADETATRLAGAWVGPELEDHFLRDAAAVSRSSVYDTHPTPQRRVARLKEPLSA